MRLYCVSYALLLAILDACRRKIASFYNGCLSVLFPYTLGFYYTAMLQRDVTLLCTRAPGKVPIGNETQKLITSDLLTSCPLTQEHTIISDNISCQLCNLFICVSKEIANNFGGCYTTLATISISSTHYMTFQVPQNIPPIPPAVPEHTVITTDRRILIKGRIVADKIFPPKSDSNCGLGLWLSLIHI